MPQPEILIDPRELDGFTEVSTTVDKAIAAASELDVEEITDEEQASLAADLLAGCKYARKDIATEKKEAGAPYAATKKRIDAVFDELAGKLSGVEESLKARVLAWNQKKQAAAAAERKREEDNARRRQERADAKTAETGVVGKQHAPPPMPAPPQGARGSSGSKASIRKVRKYEIVNEAELPDEYTDRVPNRSKIGLGVKNGVAIPGVRVWEEDQVVSV